MKKQLIFKFISFTIYFYIFSFFFCEVANKIPKWIAVPTKFLLILGLILIIFFDSETFDR